MSAQPSPSENVADLPAMIARLPKAENPHTPTLKTPEASMVVKAVLDARVELKRSHLRDLVRPETWAIIEACGEPDFDGNPHVQSINAMHCFMAINYERKVYGNSDPLLIKAEGAESTHFDHFSQAAGVEVQP